MALHVFSDGETDWYVAESPEDAAALQRELTGLKTEDQDWTFEALPDAASLSIYPDDGRKPGSQVTKTCAEWAASNSRGFLCSTEY